MKTNTSLHIESSVLDDARRVAAADGENFSAFAERAIRRELLRGAAIAAATWEHRRGMDTPEYAEAVAVEAVANLQAAYGAGSAR